MVLPTKPCVEEWLEPAPMLRIHTGLQHSIIWPSQPNCLPVSFTTLPQKLQDEGYATHAVGKWHVGFYKKECLPTNRGFDTFFGYLTGSEDYWTHFRSGGNQANFLEHWYGYDLHDNLRPAWEYTGNYSAYVFTERVQNIFKSHNQDEPFFLYLALQSVHSPLQAPQKYINMYSHIKNKNRRLYAAMTTCMDDAVGNIVKSLQDLQLWNNTLLIFSTDNGGQVAEGGNNWPLRGWKGSYWEGGMKAVGFASSPLLPSSVQGTITNELMHVSDWFPTLVEGIAKGNIRNTELDGFNVWSTISEGKPSPRKELLHNIDAFEEDDKSTFNVNMTAAIRVGDWKLITGHPGADNGAWIPVPNSGINAFKPLLIPDQNVWLFNITGDPYEYRDLSQLRPDIVSQLTERLHYYYNKSVPAYYPDPDPKANPALHEDVWGPWL
ncbi:arylsulfatase J-like [Anneissia japonica]|uniref:arylsulfatase J-like n=1 Tax=Anneissia japonica TaxID=1529436 RepID=UPI001425ABA7|nr:arylsulfatase J-like [Anneissia japonica]